MKMLIYLSLAMVLTPAGAQEAVSHDVEVRKVKKVKAVKDLPHDSKKASEVNAELLREVERCFKSLGAETFRERRKASRRLVEIATMQNVPVTDGKGGKRVPAPKPGMLEVVQFIKISGNGREIDERVELRCGKDAYHIQLSYFVEYAEPFPYFWAVMGRAGELCSHTDPEVKQRARGIVEKCKEFVSKLEEEDDERW